MWLGPVFNAELLTSARRPRFFVGRVLYGLLVLIIVSSTYHSMTRFYLASRGGEVPISVLARLGQEIFTSFAVLQGIILLVMTPALVGGAIADEKQRKTLHYLMASELTATEIIVGKIASRLLRLAILGAIGLPVLSLVGLFGGVDYPLVFLVYGATATSTYFLAALAILCSVHAAKPRDAIMQCFFYEILWLTVAPITLATMPFWNPYWRPIGEFCRPALEWVAACSPSYLLTQSMRLRGLMAILPDVWWMIGLQLAVGTLFLIIAAARLRPAFRAQDGPNLWARIVGRKQIRARWRLWPHPECGDDAMLWKEIHVNRLSNARKIVLFFLSVGVLGFTIYASFDVWVLAFNEAWNSGYWGFSSNQRNVNYLLRGANSVAIIILLIGMGAVAASSLTSEKEGDTWINLASSPLSGVEVIRGKLLGAIWLFRPVFYLLALCWTLGLLVGSIHPLGILASLGELAVFSWFIAALGVAVSLRSRSTVQSLTLTIGILLFCNVGYLFLVALIRSGGDELNVIGCMPALFTVSLLGSGDLRNSSASWFQRMQVASVLGTLLYAVAAWTLTYYAITRYDTIVDRPNRFRNDLTPERLQQIRAMMAKPPLSDGI